MQSRSPRRGSQPASKKANRKKPNPQPTQKRADRIGAFLLFALCFPFLCWGVSLYAFPVSSSPQPLIEAASSAPDTSASFPPPNTLSQDPTGPKVTLASLTNTPAAADSGSPSPATDTPASTQGFVGKLGHVTDSATGLVYMRARYYVPAIGRFINEDPSKNGSNYYTYANDNPTNLTDFSGKIAGDDDEDEADGTIFSLSKDEIANIFQQARTGTNAQIKNLIRKGFPQFDDAEAGTIIHNAKAEFGMGGADNIAVGTGEYAGLLFNAETGAILDWADSFGAGM